MNCERTVAEKGRAFLYTLAALLTLCVPEVFTLWTAAGTGATFRWHAWQRDSSSS